MVFYDDQIIRRLKKGVPPKEIVKTFFNAFKSLDVTKDLNMFDIKRLKTNDGIDYYRLRKGNYRAIFHITDGDFYVMIIAKREEVYTKWL